MGKYETDRQRSDAVLPDVQWVLKKACDWDTRLAAENLDVSQATDLIANKCIHVAVRSRSYGRFFEKYGNEFTLRSRRESGIETELSKIRSGFGKYLFYGFCEGYHHRFFRIIDLDIFRSAIEQLGADAVSVEKANGDGTFFRAFDVRNFGNMPIEFKWGAA